MLSKLERFTTNLKISLFAKLILLTIVVELFSLVIAVISFRTFKMLEQNDTAKNIVINVMEINSIKKEFRNRRDSNFSATYYSNINDIDNLFKQLNIDLSIISEVDINVIKNLLNDYRIGINEYIKYLKIIGLTENEGIEGDFRYHVHQAENSFNLLNIAMLNIDLLQARRAEKDYIVRGRKEYFDKTINFIKEINREIQQKSLPQNDKKMLLYNIKNYEDSFIKFSEVYEKIKNVERNLKNIEAKIDNEIAITVSKIVNEAESTKQLLNPIVIFSLISGLIFAIIIAQSITKPVRILQKATMQISEGDFKVIVNVKSNDEIGELAKFFNDMVSNIHSSNQLILTQKETLEKQNTSLNELNATKDLFFSIIAHDLKNPLGAFKQSTEVLFKEFDYMDTDEIKIYLEELYNSSEQVFELLENLLTWSRSQRGKIAYHPIEIPLKFIVDNNINLLKLIAEKKNIKLSGNISSDIFVKADANMLTTVIRNLLSNAIKFTKENGEVRVDGNHKNGMYQISIIDNGVGISAENIEKLFRVDTHFTTVGTTNEQGTGLGLIICKEFIEKHEGEIWVESELGKGASFCFTVPKAN